MSIQSYIYQDPQEVSAACAVKILQSLEESLVKAPLATIAISGGSTPKLLFGELATAGFDWFDIMHRGMGPDMHMASLFPGEPLINDQEHLAGAAYVEKFHQWRITRLPGVLEAARNTIMLVAGGDKAEPLRTVLHEPYDPMKYPVQIATLDGRNVLWFLDKPAARLLN
jgi:6-phosphogluconolactonase/glucosamine-6-phosphate isomerase/deaminase